MFPTEACLRKDPHPAHDWPFSAGPPGMLHCPGVPTATSPSYAAGSRWRVVRAGARLTGWKADQPGSAVGWRHDLAVGDVVESLGHGRGPGADPGYGIHWKVDDPLVFGVSFWPMVGGIWNYQPHASYLAPYP